MEGSVDDEGHYRLSRAFYRDLNSPLNVTDAMASTAILHLTPYLAIMSFQDFGWIDMPPAGLHLYGIAVFAIGQAGRIDGKAMHPTGYCCSGVIALRLALPHLELNAASFCMLPMPPVIPSKPFVPSWMCAACCQPSSTSPSACKSAMSQSPSVHQVQSIAEPHLGLSKQN